MRESLYLLLMAVMAVYTACQISGHKGKKYWWTGIVVMFFSVALYIGLRQISGRHLSGGLACLGVMALCFIFLRVFTFRLTKVFYICFGMLLAAFAGLLYQMPGGSLWYSAIAVAVLLLTENSQRFVRRTYEEQASEYQNKILTQQVNEVQNIYMTMRGWRHDYHNHLQSLKAYLKLGEIARAGEYLNHLENDLDQVNQLFETGNVSVDAILNSKISLALQQEIEVDYKATVPAKLTVKDIDLCVLIGNLIDNAAEACGKQTEGRKFIRLYIGILKKQLYISVTNSTAEHVRKLDEEYISTKRGNHGHGLKRINLIVEKYEGYINRQNEPGVFVTEIMLPL